MKNVRHVASSHMLRRATSIRAYGTPPYRSSRTLALSVLRQLRWTDARTNTRLGKFVTLPEGNEDSGGTLRLVAFSLHGLGLSSAGRDHRSAIEGACSAISSAQPGCCLALGGPSAPQGVFPRSCRRQIVSIRLMSQLLSMSLQHLSFPCASGPLCTSAHVLGNLPLSSSVTFTIRL